MDIIRINIECTNTEITTFCEIITLALNSSFMWCAGLRITYS